MKLIRLHCFFYRVSRNLVKYIAFTKVAFNGCYRIPAPSIPLIGQPVDSVAIGASLGDTLVVYVVFVLLLYALLVPSIKGEKGAKLGARLHTTCTHWRRWANAGDVC